MKTPRTLQEAIQFFCNFDNCRDFMISIRWTDGKVRCPQCGSDQVMYLENARLYKCKGKHAKQKFSLKVGTVFEDSPIALEKWLPAVWMLVNDKNGISSYEIHRALGVTQKTAWFMLHRIRLAMQCGSFVKLGRWGKEVEVDETFIGGAARFMSRERHSRLIKNRRMKGKTIVVGLLERDGSVRAVVTGNRRKAALEGLINENVQPGANVYTDNLPSYNDLSDAGFAHKVIDHAERYVDGKVHTNGMENFWSLLKRGLKGTYISVAVPSVPIFGRTDLALQQPCDKKESDERWRSL